MVLVYITCKDNKEAEKISLHLLKKRLIACSNIIPTKSLYRWEDKIVKVKETVIIAKTNNKNYRTAVNEVKRIHSYEIPCIVKIDAKAVKDYECWANNELK